MMLFINRAKTGEDFLQKFGKVFNSEKILLTNNVDIYKGYLRDEIEKRYLSPYFNGIFGRMFGFAYVEPYIFNNESLMLKALSVAKMIMCKHNTELYFINEFKRHHNIYESARAEYDKIKAYNEEVKEFNKSEKSRVKELNRKIKADYKEALTVWQKECKDIDSDYKKILSSWEEIYEKADENMKPFLVKPVKPDYSEEPKREALHLEPVERQVRELPSIHSLRKRVNDTLGFRIFRNFRIIESGGYIVFLKRDDTISLRDDISIEIEVIDEDALIDLMKNHDMNHGAVKNLTQSFYDNDVVSKVSDVDDSIFELVIKETNDEDMIFQPLAPIKTMHATSILAGGLGEYIKELKLDGENFIVKSANITDYEERVIVENGVQVKESIESYKQRLGVYNMDTFDFKML